MDDFGSFEITSDGCRATLAPRRGGMVTRFRVHGEERMYLDEATLRDPSKNVRGGNPVLFPSPGKLRDDRWSRLGRAGSMKQHGFARNVPWSVERREADAATLVLESSAQTRAEYPWDFRVELAHRVAGTTLRIEQRVIAGSSNGSSMPFGFGFHPYFRVPQEEKRAATIETGATRAFDNVRKLDVDLHGIDLAQPEVDLHLLDHGCSESELAWHHGTSRVRIRASDAYRHWVVWTVADKDYVCLEPWTTRGNALNGEAPVIELAPGQRWDGFVEFVG